METSNNEQTKDLLLKSNQTFRDLVQQHQNYETRLTELGHLNYPNEDEQNEENILKKKKLRIKDEIQAMLTEHSKSH